MAQLLQFVPFRALACRSFLDHVMLIMVSLWFHYGLMMVSLCIFRAFLVLHNAPAEVQAPIRCRNETAARRHNVQRVGSDTAGTSTHWFLAVPNWPKQWLKDAELNGT